MSVAKGVLVMALLGTALNANAWEINRSIDVAPGGRLDVDTDQGRIHVTTHNRDVVDITVEFSGFDEDEVDFDVRQSGDEVQVDLDVSRSHGWGRRHVEFTILVPENYNVDLNTSGGSITVSNLQGTVEAKTSGGRLEFEQITGDIRGRTSGGRIEVRDVDGNVKVDTSGGSIDIEDVTRDVVADTSGGKVTIENVGGDLEAETSGGSMRIAEIRGGTEASTSGGSIRSRFSTQPTGDISLSTSGGSIGVELDSKADMSLRAHARRIRSDFRVDGQTSAKRRLNGPINDGGPMLDLQASSGSITIDSI
jgi:hypothetical protein